MVGYTNTTDEGQEADMDHMSEFEIYAAFNEIISQSYTPEEQNRLEFIEGLYV